MKKLLLLLILMVFLVGNTANAEIFSENENNPVFSFSDIPGTFDYTRISSWSIMKDAGVYKMWYSGLSNSNYLNIGLATSSDGVSWQRYSNDPVFRCGEDTLVNCSAGNIWSSYRVTVVDVLHEDSVYKMWYQGNNQNLNAVSSLGYATSPDGINWTPYASNPVFLASAETGNSYLNIINIDGVYNLFYRKSTSPDLYLATSTDGVSWSEYSDEPIVSSVSNMIFVGEINNQYIAINNIGDLSISENGSEFILNEALDTHYFTGWISLLSDEGIIKNWYSINEGNINWNYGNFSVGYATTSFEMFGILPVVDVPTFTTLSEDGMVEIANGVEYPSMLPIYEGLMDKVVQAYERGHLVRADRRLERFKTYIREGLGKLLFSKAERRAISAIINDMQDILVTEG